MSDGVGMGATTAMADKAGPASDGSRPSDGQDCAARAFHVGDRVQAVVEGQPGVSGMGVLKQYVPGGFWKWTVLLDRGLTCAYHASELTLLQEPWDGWVAVDGITKSWSVRIEEGCEELAKLLSAKRKAYGPKAIVDSPYGWEIALITRLHEKFERLVHIQKNPSDSSFEDLAESFKDLAGVAILGWIHAQEEM